MNITNMKDLETQLMKMLGESMLEIAIDAESKVKEHLKTEVYDKYTPSTYQRTYELMNSVDANVKQPKRKRVTAEIFHNTNLMKAVAPYDGNNHIGQHYSTYPYNPSDYRDYIAQTINFGIGAGKKKVFGNGVYAKPRPYFTNAEVEVNKNFDSHMKLSLIRQGLTIV